MMTGLFKPVKKPVIRHLSAPGGDIGPYRPQYSAKTAPCTGACPSVGDIRGWLTAVADAEANLRTPEQALRSAWEKISARNPFPSVCGRVCPADCEQVCPREAKDGAVAIRAFERYIGDLALELAPISHTPPADVAQGVPSGPVPAVSRLVSTPFRGCDTVSKTGVGMSADAAGTGPEGTPCATSPQPNPCEKWGLGLAHGLTPAVQAAGRREAAVSGAGPAGLSCACQLARRGWRVTVFDAAEPGGFLRALPGLPAEILDREIARITALGVTLRPEPAPGVVAFTDPGGTLAKLPHLIAEGRIAAEAFDNAARGLAPEKRDAPPRVAPDRIKTSWYVEAPRHEEIRNESDAVAEARRCFACGTCMGCGNCWMYCSNGCFEKTPKGNRFKLKIELCHGCSRCAEECPSGYIDML